MIKHTNFFIMNKKNYYLLILGLLLAGVFIPTIVGDTNNRLITIPAGIGLVLIGYAFAKLKQE
jgi:hypothetical protein